MLDSVSILDGNQFVVSNRQGDLDAAPDRTHGLFLDDTPYHELLETIDVL